MSRRKAPINPKHGERVKLLCKEQGISQKALADAIHITQQTISKIVQGKCSLTEQNAQIINSIFPSYSVGWLLGYSNFKTEQERSLSELAEWDTEWKRRLLAVRTLAFLAGYEIELFPNRESGAAVDEWLNQIDTGYKIIKDGKIVGTCPLERFNLLALDIQELTEQRIKSYLREVSDNG